MNNRSLGNSFETELCELLSSYGFWVHPMRQDNSGQPADIIAVKNRIAYLIDAKVCSNNKFSLSRIEENQDLAMELWDECGNGLGWFALKTGSGIYMFSHYCIKVYLNQQPSLSAKDIAELGLPVGKWVERCE